MAVVVHDKKDHSNALVTLDFLSKEEYKKFNHTDNATFVKPERLAAESVTNAIVLKVIDLVEEQIANANIVGVIRSQESPNTEKDITILKDEKGVYWTVISISNIGEGAESVEPIVEDVRVVEANVMTKIMKYEEKEGPSE